MNNITKQKSLCQISVGKKKICIEGTSVLSEYQNQEFHTEYFYM